MLCFFFYLLLKDGDDDVFVYVFIWLFCDVFFVGCVKIIEYVFIK